MTSPMAATVLGIAPIQESSPVELRANATEEERQLVIREAYRQVFGNAHLMEDERLSSAESQLCQGTITVREFVRTLALSELYRQRFFYSTPQVRFIELNYKHLLGRAPNDESEIAEQTNLYVSEGYEAAINSLIDSPEYQDNFGESIVPYYRGFNSEQNQKGVGFPRMFQLYRGPSNSDRAQNNKAGRLTYELATNTATPIRVGNFGRTIAGTTLGGRSQVYRVRVARGAAKNAPQVRSCVGEYLVPYEQLSKTLQRLGKQGERAIEITPA